MYLIIRVPSRASCKDSVAQLEGLGEWLDCNDEVLAALGCSHRGSGFTEIYALLFGPCWISWALYLNLFSVGDPKEAKPVTKSRLNLLKP